MQPASVNRSSEVRERRFGIRFLRSACLALLFFAASAAAEAEEIRITDIEGRTVVLPAPPKRILLGDGHLLIALALIHPKPAGLVVASQGDLKRHSPDIYERFRAAEPKAVDAIKMIGEASPATFSIEGAIAAAPDVALFGGTYGPTVHSTDILAGLKAAGIPVIFIDFAHKPLENTAPSMRILGKLLGRERDAEDFASFYESRLKLIRERVAGLPQAGRPSALLRAFGGVWDCCWIAGSAGLGEFIDVAGGRNLGDAVFPNRAWGRVSLEWAVVAAPDVYITTGTSHVANTGGVALGTGVDEMVAKRSLAAMLAQAPELAAERARRGFGVWHLLHDLPVNIVAVEAFAKWLHPTLFADLDPNKTMAEINTRFLSVPLAGTFVVSTE